MWGPWAPFLVAEHGQLKVEDAYLSSKISWKGRAIWFEHVSCDSYVFFSSFFHTFLTWVFQKRCSCSFLRSCLFVHLQCFCDAFVSCFPFCNVFPQLAGSFPNMSNATPNGIPGLRRKSPNVARTRSLATVSRGKEQ